MQVRYMYIILPVHIKQLCTTRTSIMLCPMWMFIHFSRALPGSFPTNIMVGDVAGGCGSWNNWTYSSARARKSDTWWIYEFWWFLLNIGGWQSECSDGMCSCVRNMCYPRGVWHLPQKRKRRLKSHEVPICPPWKRARHFAILLMEDILNRSMRYSFSRTFKRIFTCWVVDNFVQQ